MVAEPFEQTTLATPNELAALTRLRDITSGQVRPRLVGPQGEHIEIPESLFVLFRFIIDRLAEGESVTVVPRGTQLTTQQAADLLHISRPHLVKLLEEGAIPFHRVGTHRRLQVEDVLRYRTVRAERRSGTLQAIRDLGQEAMDRT